MSVYTRQIQAPATNYGYGVRAGNITVPGQYGVTSGIPVSMVQAFSFKPLPITEAIGTKVIAPTDPLSAFLPLGNAAIPLILGETFVEVDFERTLKATAVGTALVGTITLFISGFDYLGNQVTSQFVLNSGNSYSAETPRGYFRITSCQYVQSAASADPVTLTLLLGSKLVLPYNMIAPFNNNLLMVNYNGNPVVVKTELNIPYVTEFNFVITDSVLLAAQTLTTGTSRPIIDLFYAGLYAPNAAFDGTKVMTIYMCGLGAGVGEKFSNAVNNYTVEEPDGTTFSTGLTSPNAYISIYGDKPYSKGWLPWQG